MNFRVKPSVKRVLISIMLGLSVVSAAVAHSWYVCLSSFEKLENAFATQKQLAVKNVPALVTMHYVNERKMYRLVYDMEFETSAEARNYKYILEEELEGKTDVSSLWVCRAFDFLQEEELSVEEPAVVEKALPVVEKALPVVEKPLPKKNASAVVKAPSVVEAPEPAPAPIVLTKNLSNSEQISEEKPYSVKIRSYKEEQNALRDQQRLKEQEIESYILKTFDSITLFGFDLFSGAFATEEETEAVQEKLEELGITDTEIATYEEVEEKVEQYNQVIEEQTVTYEDGKTVLPTGLSKYVKSAIRNFPVNRDFSIQQAIIADFDNMKTSENTSEKEDAQKILESFKEIFDFNEDQCHALSFVVYNDELYDRKINVFMLEGNKETFATVTMEDKITYNFQLTDGIITSYLVMEKGSIELYGINSDASLFMAMQTEDFSEKEFKEFLDNSKNDSGLLIYPQIRKNLAVLPDKANHGERDMSFLYFEFEQVDESYAAERDYSDWSKAVVGHWKAEGVFNSNETPVTIAFFDMDYDYNAEKIHKMFMDYRKVGLITDGNRPANYERASSWYSDKSAFNELSYSVGSYIVAIDSENPGKLTEDELIGISDRLKIWK